MVTSIQNEHLRARIKHHGAELCSLKRSGSETEYIWQGDPKFWARHAPVLFPIVGRLKNDRYIVSGDSFKMGQHGFARDLLFREIEIRSDSATFEITDDNETIIGYPFRFRLELCYQLLEKLLRVRYVVTNRDEKRIFFSIGAHPAFNCPINSGETFEGYCLEFEKPESAVRHFLEKGLFNGETASVLSNRKDLKLSSSLFERDAMVFKGLKSDFVTLKHASGASSVKLEFRGFPFFGIWTKPGAPFVCLEPWFGLADRHDATGLLQEKEGIQSLEPGGRFQCQYHITVA